MNRVHHWMIDRSISFCASRIVCTIGWSIDRFDSILRIANRVHDWMIDSIDLFDSTHRESCARLDDRFDRSYSILHRELYARVHDRSIDDRFCASCMSRVHNWMIDHFTCPRQPMWRRSARTPSPICRLIRLQMTILSDHTILPRSPSLRHLPVGRENPPTYIIRTLPID
jgi:hypothetical protein